MRGITIGINYQLRGRINNSLDRVRNKMRQINRVKDEGQGKIKQYFGRFKQGVNGALPSLERFSLKNAEMFNAMEAHVPFLGKLGPMLSNPYVLAAAAVAALIVGVVKLGKHLMKVSKEIETNQRDIKFAFNITGEELDRVNARATAVSKTIGVENKELIRAAQALNKEYKNLSALESIELLRQGLQATNGTLDLEEIREYSSQMKAAGLNAQEFVALSALGKKEGIFNDKAVDAVKEFNLRIKEMTPAAEKALKDIGLSSTAILKGLDDGSLRTMDILKQVSSAMAGAGTQARQTAIADLFGGAGEDAGERFLLSLGKTELSLKNMIDLEDGYIKHQNKKLELQEKITIAQQKMAPTFNGIRHQFEILILKAQVLFYDVIQKGVNWFKDNWHIIKIAFVGLRVTIGFFVAKLRLVWATLQGVFRFFGYIYDQIVNIYRYFRNNGSLFGKMMDGVEKYTFIVKLFFEDMVRAAKIAFLSLENLLKGNLSSAKGYFDQLRNFELRDYNKLYQLHKSTKENAEEKTSSNASEESEYESPQRVPSSETPLSNTASSTRQVRNVTVNIGALVKDGIHITSTTIENASVDAEQIIKEGLIRAVRNAELAL